MKKLLTLALLTLTLASCSTDEPQQEDCSKATVLVVYPAPLLQPDRQRVLIANNCTGMEHELWFGTSLNLEVGDQVDWR